ncbi:MAG: type 1 glutamine amidotransferase domain-containing protein [Candidatus Hydrothermarchaeota archaeon]
MKVLIISADGFEDSELLYPYYRMLEEGHQVTVASHRKGKITGKHGYEVAAEMPFERVTAEEYDALIIPGGRAPESVRLSEAALGIVRHFFEARKPVASICHGIQVLISAGVVKGRKATCWKGVRDDLKAAGGIYKDEEVVVDGNLITSRFPDDLPAFCRALVERLGK